MRFFFMMLVFFISGCISPEAFQPPPSTYEQWKKKGSSINDVKTVMLECGYPDWGATGESPGSVAEMERCMENSGFVYSSRFGTFCKQQPNLSACQLNAVIPERSVQRRLESRFCKKYPKADVCQP